MHLPQPHARLSLEDRALIDKFKKAVEDVIEAMRLLVRITTEDELHSIDLLGQDRYESCGMIYAKLDKEAREAKIRLAGVLHYLHEQEIISRSKMLQLSGMTVAELNRAIDELETCER